MMPTELIPFGADAQRLLERHWLATVRDGAPSAAVRTVVRSSWERSLWAEVRPDLRRAPVALDEDALVVTREQSDWLELAHAAIDEHRHSFAGEGHILTLFDHQARMLTAEGDPAALEGLADFNFRPGALWAEQVVGTNGPGTALATGQPTHIVGAEHFCSGLQRWHCAAVPIREISSGRILGVLDISGFREYAHPHTLNLVLALGVALEQSLAARDTQRRFLTLSRLTELTAKYPGDAAAAVDRNGRVLLASPSAPPAISPDRQHPGLTALTADLVARTRDQIPREVEVRLSEDQSRRGVWYPVFDGRTVVGGCLVLEHKGGPTSPRSSRSLPGSTTRYSFADVLGESPALHAARETARIAADTDVPVLLLGESGTGKEVFAQAIHQASDRRLRPFVAVNCAALPRELVESELFGYTGGAFSGARREGGVGKFEAAHGGTIFLDEIGELPPTAQAALLRVLQEGEITRVGSPHSHPVDVRLIAATNRDIQTSLAEGHLRADLYYRLNVMPIELPPLRSRPEDIRLLARRFFELAARDLGRPEVVIDDAVFDAFAAYPWPGNVRELKNVVRRLMVVTSGRVQLFDLPQAVRASHLGIGPTLIVAAPPADRSLSGPPAATSRIDQEDARLMDVVNSSRTMAEAAARLGITRSTLYRRMERFGLKPRRVLGR